MCKKAIVNKTLLGAEGLGHECKVLTNILGLPDLRDKFATTSKGEIGKANIVAK